MKQLIFTLLLFLPFLNCRSQNLVPNGDFEQYSGCPIGQGRIDSAIPWSRPTDGGTSDYYNTCYTTYGVGIPVNFMGYQNARSGNAYAGLFTFSFGSSIEYREYIQVKLTDTLKAGRCYHFEMFINLSNKSKVNASNIGAHFSDTMVSKGGLFVPSYDTILNLIPQINNTIGNYPDTLNWRLVQGDFIAQGNEEYMVLGNFDSNSLIDSVINSGNLANNTYLYIDDVSLVDCTPENATNYSKEKNVEVFPNPFHANLNIKSSSKKVGEFVLYDIYARVIFRGTVKESRVFNFQDIPNGIFFYNYFEAGHILQSGKVVKE